jgi:U3 small nucleolar RNA-associated protein 25
MSKVEESDIIISTPVSLKQEYNESKLKRVLSSIELCILDQAETIYMQNWEHLYDVFEMMNVTPEKTNGENEINISHVRDFNLFGLYIFFI